MRPARSASGSRELLAPATSGTLRHRYAFLLRDCTQVVAALPADAAAKGATIDPAIATLIPIIQAGNMPHSARSWRRMTA